MQDQEAQIARKKRRATTRTAARSIAGTSLEVGKTPNILWTHRAVQSSFSDC